MSNNCEGTLLTVAVTVVVAVGAISCTRTQKKVCDDVEEAEEAIVL